MGSLQYKNIKQIIKIYDKNDEGGVYIFNIWETPG